MTQEMAVHVVKEALFIAFLLAGPMLAAGLVIGLLVGIFQSVTQIHEMTLTFIPKILAVAAVLILLLPWMAQALLSFTRNLFELIAGAG